MRKGVPIGRPEDYTPEMGRRICELLSTNTISMAKMCRMHDDLPHIETIRRWRLNHEDFRANYFEAKRIQSDLLIESLEDLDDQINYYLDDKGNNRIDAPSVALLVAKANNRKWVASRLMPVLYGDANAPDSTGKQLTDEVKEKVKEINKENEKEF